MMKMNWTVACLLAAGEVMASATQQGTTKALVEGVVVDAATGAPIRGASVRLQCRRAAAVAGVPANVNLTTSSDAMGRFAFRDLPACRGTLEAARDRYLDGRYGQRRPGRGLGTSVAILDGQAVRGLTIRLALGGVIGGQVLDRFGEPGTGVRVEALRYIPAPTGIDLQLAGHEVADDRGYFRIFGLAPGDYVVRARTTTVEGRATSQLPARTAPPTPLCVLSTGDPSAASVYFPASTSVGGAGHIALGPSEDRQGVVIRFPETRQVLIHGKLIAPGAPLSEVQAYLFDMGTCATFATADGRGAFSLGPVPIGSYRLEVRARGPAILTDPRFGPDVARSGAMLWSSAEIVASGDGPITVAYQLAPGLKVRGSVFTDQGPWSATTRGRTGRGPTITLTARTGTGAPPFQIATNIGDDGWFEFAGVPPGQYQIAGSPNPILGTPVSVVAGARDVLDFGLHVQASGGVPPLTLTYSAKGTRLDGQMVIQSSRPGVENVSCYAVLFARDPAFWVPFSRRVNAVVPDALGQFSIRGVPAGDYFLAAFQGDEPDNWSDPRFLGGLRRDVQVTVLAGAVTGPVQLTCHTPVMAAIRAPAVTPPTAMTAMGVSRGK